MTEPEIFARLTALHSAIVEKIGRQPFISPSVSMRDDACHIHIYGVTGSSLCMCKADTCDAVLKEAEEYVADMPDIEAAKLSEWRGRLADVIDDGHAMNLPDEVMTPLRQSSQAMTENLLTHAPE